MANNKVSVVELGERVAELWRERGVCGVTYSALSELTKIARGSIQHHYPKAPDMLRAGALAIVGDGTPDVAVLTAADVADLVTSEASNATVAVFEAHCWLARNGE